MKMLTFVLVHTSWNLNTKVKHIIDQVEKDIKSAILTKGQQLLSLTEVQHRYKVSRDTANRAYRDLLKRGVIESKRGKGYYVLNDKDCFHTNVFLLLDQLSDYKNTLVESVILELGARATCKVFFHHYDEYLFKALIEQNSGKFTHYVVSPFPYSKVVEETLQQIPFEELILIDRRDGNFPDYQFVGQDYQFDIIQCLMQLASQIQKYQSFKFIFPTPSNHPIELQAGFASFCKKEQIPFEIIPNFQIAPMKAGDAYLVIDDNDLADIIEATRAQKMTLGEDIGLIAYNDTRLKAAIGITTISTDFKEMGSQLVDFLFNHPKENNIRNKAYLNQRTSF